MGLGGAKAVVRFRASQLACLPLDCTEPPMPERGAAVSTERCEDDGCHAPKLCGCQWPATENHSALVLMGAFLPLITVL